MSRSIRLFSIPALVLALSPAALAGHAGINGVSCAYNSVQDAIDAASPGGTVWVAEGWNADPGFVVTKRLTLERGTSSCQSGGNANAVLDFGAAGRAEVAANLSAVVLDHVTLFDGAGTNGGNLAIGGNSHVYLDDVAVWAGDATGDGGGVYVASGSTLEVDGLLVLGNTAEDGAGIYGAAGSTLDLSDSLYMDLDILDNDATDWGGGIACFGCTLTMQDATVDGNTADLGGGITVFNAADAEVTGGTFSDNSATYGGGAYTYMPGAVAFTSVDFAGNTADLRGGAILVDDSTGVTVTDSTFTSNSAVEHGGAIHVFTSDLDVEHSRFETNSSERGGAIYVDTEGGSDHFITIDRSTLFDNTATLASTGSGIDIRGGTSNVTISNSQIVGGNSPASPGGAVVAQASAFLTLLDSTVAYNERYGVVSSSGATTTMMGVIVWANDQGVYGVTSGDCTDVQGGALAGPRNISANPLFTDPANADLTVQSASPAKDACPRHVGTSLDNHDRNVGRSDMGAFDHP